MVGGVADRMCSRVTIFSLVLIAVPVVYQYYRHGNKVDNNYTTKEHIVQHSAYLGMDDRIAIGLNADVDYIVSAVELLKALHARPGQIRSEHLTLSTIEELQQTVAYSMKTCSGIERHFDDKFIFDEIVQTTAQLKHEEFVGGNAALMANTIARVSPHSKILLAAPVGSKLRQFLSTSIETVSSSDTPEEIHVILEYAKGEKWGEVTATCANRVIISHDVENSKLSSLESFSEAIKTFRPTLIILSGLHMLEGQPESAWMTRLNDITQVLKDIPRTIPVHLEMATVGNLKFLPLVADVIFPFIDSLGLNEQELVSLAKSKNANFDFVEVGPKPSITHTSDLLHWLYNRYSILNTNGSRFSRIHFHSLSFHVIVVPKDELGGVQWLNTLTAAAKGSRIASLQACDANQINSDDFELQIPEKFPLSFKDKTLLKSTIEYTAHNDYIAWNRVGTVDYHLVPVYVCKVPVKTVGLGDAISATGLLQSKFVFTKRKLRSRVKKGDDERK